MPEKKKPMPPPIADTYGKPLTELLPDVFENAREVPVVQNNLPTGDYGYYAEKANPTLARLVSASKIPEQQKEWDRQQEAAPFIVLTNKTKNHRDNPNMTAMHEAAHAIWFQDASRANQNAWTDLHNKYTNGHDVGMSMTYPYFYDYKSDPSHSFAEAFAHYAIKPEELQRYAPDVYDYFKKLTGFEYSRRQK